MNPGESLKSRTWESPRRRWTRFTRPAARSSNDNAEPVSDAWIRGTAVLVACGARGARKARPVLSALGQRRPSKQAAALLLR